MADGPGTGRKRACRSVCGCISLVVFFYLLISWLILLTARSPKLTLIALQLPVHNTTLSYMILVYNPNTRVGIHFSDLNTSFHYPANESSALTSFGHYGYYLNSKKRILLTGNNTVGSEINLIEGGGGQSVRVHVNGRVKYRESWMRTGWRKLSVEGVTEVDKQGSFVDANSQRHMSGATMNLPNVAWYLLVWFGIYLFNNNVFA